MTFKPWRVAGVALSALAIGAAPAQASKFETGAASADITPPPYTTESDAAFVPTCGTTPAQVKELWPGPREFAFEKPYIDTYGLGRYAPGDPYCESNGTHRYEAPYLAGGGGQDRWPIAAEAGNSPAAEAVVFAVGSSRVALVSIDSIGMFNVTMNRIRAEVKKLDPDIGDVFISSTHDESAPDPIGLWGPNTSELPESPETPSGTSSGVDEYYFDFLVERVAHAVATADAQLKPATLNVAIAHEPSNVQSCWSSYPFIDDQAMPVMQARDKGGNVIFTLADVSTHAETMGYSGVKEYIDTLSADWPGKMRANFEARWPGSVGIELAGMVGSVETPTVYEPESTQVVRVPEAKHGVPGNPNGCSSVYPDPTSGTPVSEAREFLSAYGQSVADTVAAALESAHAVVANKVKAQQESVCVPLENTLFKAAFTAGLFPDRPLYADSACTVEAKTGGVETSSVESTALQRAAGAGAGAGPQAGPSSQTSAEPAYLKTNVGVLTLGQVQLAYSPGEIFPFTEIGGPIDEAQMPFPTNCYEPTTENYYCGTPLPMTPFISAEMTEPYRFLVGLGEDMIGYLMPPGNFVGSEGEVASEPWASYEAKHGEHDRFGYGHADDDESVGPYAGLSVTTTLQALLKADGRRHALRRVPGMFVDGEGHFSDSPFASSGFSGAVGVEALYKHKLRKLLVGHQAKGWATFDGRPDPGTAGTSLPYSVSTRGIINSAGRPLLIDVFAGANEPGL